MDFASINYLVHVKYQSCFDNLCPQQIDIGLHGNNFVFNNIWIWFQQKNRFFSTRLHPQLNILFQQDVRTLCLNLANK